jgi:CheY-like chemotaxis protein
VNRFDVLVVEDDECTRDVMLDVLADEGYRVLGLAYGREVLPTIFHAPPHLMLLDRHLADCDAAEVVVAVRDTPHLRSIPIVLMSAGTRVEAEADLLELDGALAKPFILKDLLACVAQFLASPSEREVNNTTSPTTVPGSCCQLHGG